MQTTYQCLLACEIWPGIEQPLEKKEGIYHNGWKIYRNKERIYTKEVKKGGNLPKGGFVLSLNSAQN